MDPRLGAALAYLRTAGFRSVAAPRGTRHFEGELACRNAPVKVRLEVHDWDFIDYPVVRLVDRPSFLAQFLPHLLPGSALCYFAPGLVVLDRYHPDRSLARCLLQATSVLDRLADDPEYRLREFQREFGAIWAVGQLPLPIPVLLGEAGGDEEPLTATFFEGDTHALMLSHRQDEARRLAEVRGWTARAAPKMHCRAIRTTDTPTLPTGGMPRDTSDLFAWLKNWSHDVFARVQQVLKEKTYLLATSVVFIVRTPAGPFGFLIHIDSMRAKACMRRPQLYRQFLHSHGTQVPIERLAVEEVGAEFVFSRNLQFPSLKDKRITLIGCGAIGGFIAHGLARLGAGSGPEGRLVLVDPEDVQPGNLGRHVLGMDSLFASKAISLKKSLERQFPELKIRAEYREAQIPKDLTADLIINATGIEPLSEALNAFHVRLPESRRPPLLHTWVLGNGECVQALWVDRPKFACFRCLILTDDNLSRRFSPIAAPPETRMHGCSAFTPYAISAPMTAAALTLEMVASWLGNKSNPSPRFRTRIVDGACVQQLKNQDLRPLEACPACRRR